MVEEGLVVTFKGDADPLEKAAAAGERSMKRFNTSAEKTGQALSKMSVKSNGAGQAVLDLSRIASDAPYGFMAISNNIEQVFGSLGRLKDQTGSVGGAIKSMGSALIGPAGIGLAYSVVSALVLKYGDSLFNTKSASEAAAEAIKKQKEALQSFVDTLGDVDKARVTGSQNAQEELVKLQALYTATQNTNLSYVERKKAVDALQEQYPKYFANMSDEAILAGKGKKAYDSLRDAILAAAKARAAQDIMVDIQKQVLAIEEKQAVLQADKAKADVEASKQSAIAAESANKNFDKFNTAVVKASTAQATANAKTKESIDLEKQRQALLARANNLSQYVQVTVEDNGVDALTNDFKGKIKKNKVEIIPTFPKIERLKLPVEMIPIQRGKQFDADQFKIDFGKIVVNEDKLKWLRDDIALTLQMIEDAKYVEKMKTVADTVSSVLAPAFGNMYNAILSGKEPMETFFKSLQQSINQLIGQLIQAAIRAAILSAFTGGASNFASGGMSFLTAFKGIAGFASGGLVTGPTLGLIGEGSGTRASNPEVIAPLSDLKKFLSPGNGGAVKVTGRLRGNDMVLQNSRTNRRQRRGG